MRIKSLAQEHNTAQRNATKQPAVFDRDSNAPALNKELKLQYEITTIRVWVR